MKTEKQPQPGWLDRKIIYSVNLILQRLDVLSRQTKTQTEELSMKVGELATKLNELDAQLGKAQGEIVTEINNLKAALENVEIPGEAQTALDNLTAKVQALDDLNADAPATE